MFSKFQIIPSRSLVIDTNLSVEKSIQRLQSQVEPRKLLRWSRNHLPFEGEVGGSDFHIRRIIHNRNSFLPQIEGTISESEKGSKINIRMTVHPIVQAFLYYWLGSVALVVAGIFAGWVFGEFREIWFGLIPLAMLGFGSFLPKLGFRLEEKKQVNMLLELFEARTDI